MNEECLICKAPLEYLKEDIEMECELCHKKEKSKTRCVNGHYVCSECHMKGLDSLIGLCMEETSRNPVVILNKMMAMPFCHMHGPEHHSMVGTFCTGRRLRFLGCLRGRNQCRNVCVHRDRLHAAGAGKLWTFS